MSINLTRRSTLSGLGSIGLLSACNTQTSKYDAEIIVLGAGLAGLNAARILAETGKDVLVLEASDRIGGRANTLDFGKKGKTEGGGEQVGAGYARFRNIADELGINIIEDATPPLGTIMHFQGKLVLAPDWPSHPENPFTPPMHTMTPSSALGRLAYANNPLKDVYGWRDPSQKAFDISAQEWLASKGLSEDALASVDISLNANSLESYSMLNLFRSLTLFQQDNSLGKSGAVEGGISNLPNAMAKALPRSVIQNEPIQSISVDAEGVSLSSKSGKKWRAKHVIAALPFPVLAKMDIEAPLGEAQKNAIQSLPYTQILQIHFAAKNRFWESDALPPSMWTDGPLERIFADKGSDGRPTGLFRAWINGTGATNLDAFSDADLADLCKSEILRIRPASLGEIEVLKIVRWTTSNPLAGGAYMHFAPGQIDRWVGKMGEPAGRLSFAGEHLSLLHTGLEGALESGENAALNLLDN